MGTARCAPGRRQPKRIRYMHMYTHSCALHRSSLSTVALFSFPVFHFPLFACVPVLPSTQIVD